MVTVYRIGGHVGHTVLSPHPALREEKGLVTINKFFNANNMCNPAPYIFNVINQWL